MTITPRFLDELRTRLTLSDIIGGRVKMTRAGREFKACCPFHKEKSPSFYVNDDKQFFHCFGCGAHGDVVGFVMRHDNLSFPEAVEQLATAAGMQMPVFSPEESHKASVQKSLFGLMEAAAKWYETQLAAPQNKDIRGYLTGRGLTDETIAGFRLGFVGNDDAAFLAHLRGSGFTDEMMIEAGLAKRREKDNGVYAFFRDRVMFPVTDRSGRVVAFGGRIVPESVRAPVRTTSDFKPPKYLNSPETPLFQKGRTVYALSQARAAASEGQGIVVVEGYMDVIACHQSGVRGAVAPLGTALTEDQIQLLWKLIPGQEKVITLCFDGDSAGLRAAERAADRMIPLLKPDHSARIAFLPDGEDPDTLTLKKGVGVFRDILAGATPLADYIWTHHVGDRALTGPEDRAGLERDLNALVLKIQDEGVRYHYKSFFRDKLNERFRPPPRVFTKGGYVPVVSVKPKSVGKNRQRQIFDILMVTLINHPAIFDQVDENIGSFDIDDQMCDALKCAVMDFIAGNDQVGPDDILNHIMNEHPQLVDLYKEITSDRVFVHARFARADMDDDVALEGWREVYGNAMKMVS